MKKKVKFQWQLSGFLIALVVIAMFVTSLTSFATSLQNNYNIEGENVFASYNDTNRILSQSENISDAVNLRESSGSFDFLSDVRAGFSAFKLSFTSFGIFSDLMGKAGQDIPVFNIFSQYILVIILIGLFVGVGITVLTKIRQ